MNRIRPGLTVAALFVLLLGVVSLPALWAWGYGNTGWNEAVLLPAESVYLESKYSSDPARQELSIWDRIQRINHSRAQVQSTGYVYLSRSGDLLHTQVQPTGTIDPDQSDDLLLDLESQLALLQTTGALPSLPLSESVSASFVQRRYLDPEKPELAVSVWVVHATYQDLSLLAYMDTELYAIYDVYVQANPGVFFLPESTDRKQGFLEYLNTFGSDAGFTREALSVSQLLNKENSGLTYLSLSSTNMQTRDYSGGCLLIDRAEPSN